MADQHDKSQDAVDPFCDDLKQGEDPWDDNLLRSAIQGKRGNCRAKRQKCARDWFRAELFYNGVQWITYDEKLRRWRDSGLKKGIPKPVTNTYASYCDIFASLVASVPTEVTYRPLNESSVINQAKVQVANELTEALQQTVLFKERQREAAPMLARQGEFFAIPYMKMPKVAYDENQEKEEFTESLAAPAGGGELDAAQPTEEGGGLETAISAVADKVYDAAQGMPNRQEGLESANIASPEESDAPVGIPMPHLDIASAFECYMDEESKGAEYSAWFLNERSYPVSALKVTFPEKAGEINPSKTSPSDISRYYAGALSQMTSGQLSGDGYFTGLSSNTGGERADLVRFWHDPCKNYPQGVFVMMVGDVVVHKGALPYKDSLGRPFKNVVQFRAKRRTDSCHGRSPLDDAIPKQIQRNKLECFMELIVYRMAAPHWLLPNGCGLDAMSGEPGTWYQYNHVNAAQNTVLKPEMIPGVQPPPTILELIRRIDEETEYIIGITKVLLGQLPPGTPAARALDLLLDRSRARHGDLFYEWNAKWAEVMNMFLNISRQVRPMGIFKVTKKNFGTFDMKNFLEDDFALDLELVPETEAPAPPRSTVSEIELINDAVKNGLFQLPPEMQVKIFQRFGLDYLVKPLEIEKKYIEREHYDLMKKGILPIAKIYENQALHLEDHRIFVMSDEYLDFKKTNPQLAATFEIEHMGAHQQMLMEQQAMMNPQQPGNENAGGASPPSGGQNGPDRTGEPGNDNPVNRGRTGPRPGGSGRAGNPG